MRLNYVHTGMAGEEHFGLDGAVPEGAWPAPALPVQVVITRRAPRTEFREVWSVVVDPSDTGVERSAPPKLNVWAVMQNGAPRDKVDLLLMGDGDRKSVV